jgi:hypothetical protein
MSDDRLAAQPSGAIPLMDSDYELLKAFVQSSIFPVYMRALDNAIVAHYRQLEGISEPKDLWLHLGRIHGIRFAQNIIPLSVKEREKQERAKAEKEALTKGRK